MTLSRTARIGAGCLLAVCAGLLAVAGTIYVPLRWDVETSRPASVTLQLYRGDYVSLEPRFLSYGDAVNLEDAYEVLLRYRSSDMAEGYYYVVTGTVASASEGRVRIPWTSDCEAEAALYDYTIAVKASEATVLRAFGTLKLAGTVSGTITNPPVTTEFDWANVEHVNVGSAPFLVTYDVGDLDGLTDVDIGSPQNGQILVYTNGMWVNLSNVTAGTVIEGLDDVGDVQAPSPSSGQVLKWNGTYWVPATDLQGSGSGSVDHLDDIGDVSVSGAEADQYLKFNGSIWVPAAVEGGSGSSTNVSGAFITATGESAASNAPPDGISLFRLLLPDQTHALGIAVSTNEVGYINADGDLVLHNGTVEIFNNWLNANPRAQDGTVGEPSISFQARQNIGWYVRAIEGLYGASFGAYGQRVLTQWLGGLEVSVGGTAAFPALTFVDTSGNRHGFYRTAPVGGASELRWMLNGEMMIGVSSNAVEFGVDRLTFASGSLAPADVAANSNAVAAVSARVDVVEAKYLPLTDDADQPSTHTPRFIGDELVIHTATQRWYRAYGTTTNDWVAQ